jgi:hypothetical protein
MLRLNQGVARHGYAKLNTFSFLQTNIAMLTNQQIIFGIDQQAVQF